MSTALLERLAGSRLARRAAETLFRRYASRRVACLDRDSATRSQEQTLLTLIQQATATRFGRDHHFATIRSVTDYQQRVPLRDYEAFWHEYWQSAFPHLTDITWPGSIPYLALSSGTTTGGTKYIPVSSAMLASNRRAALTSLAWFQVAHPHTALFAGRMFFLGGSTALNSPDPAYPSTRVGDLSGIAVHEVPALLRPYTYPPADVALLADWDEKLDQLATQSCRLPVTLVSGVPSWLLVLFERVQQLTGGECLNDIWPTLRVIVHGGTCFDPYRSVFRRLAGAGVAFLETYPASEGFVAAEDPRHGLLRLIPDHGIFFEFVPVAELSSPQPTRHTVAEIVPGVQYAVVLTTCAGLWSYLLGDTVCFERRKPPLFRFTGRTRQFLSAFGEHLIGEEIEQAVAQAAAAACAEIVDFHVGPIFPDSTGGVGRHRYLIEFTRQPAELGPFGHQIDTVLCGLNEDYRAHRRNDLTMDAPEIVPVPRGGFVDWMRSRGQLGGQHKVPRMDNSGRLTAEMMEWFARRAVVLLEG